MRAFLTMLLVLVSVIVAGPGNARAAEMSFAVIGEAGSSPRKLSRDQIARIFMRKQTYWEGGLRILPVNLPPSNALRRAFSQVVLGNAPEDFEDHWRDLYFHGVLPPYVLASEEAVVLFVTSTPGSIGYVSTCLPSHGINVVLVVGQLPVCR